MYLREGSDADYIEIEQFWSKIHEDIISQGKKMQWSIWKTSPGDPISADTKPNDYIIFNNYESQEQYDASRDIDYTAIAQRVHGISKESSKMIDSSFDPRRPQGHIHYQSKLKLFHLISAPSRVWFVQYHL